MNGYEKIRDVIRHIAVDNQSSKIELGTYQDGGILTDNLFVTSTMVYKLDFLSVRRAIKVNGKVESGGAGDSAHTHGWTDMSQYLEPLQNGDIIAYQKINDTKFLIIGRVSQ